MKSGSKSKRVLFYASVKDKQLFSLQRFYHIDITILKQLGYEIVLSNKILDSFKFWTYDFVFAYFYRYSFFVALVAKCFGKNTYITGGIDSLDRDLVTRREYVIQKFFFKLCYWIAKQCIIVSKSDDENVRMLVKGEKLTYSEHTIETTPLKCDINNKDNNFITIGWQANIGNVQRKGIDTSLRLFASLIQLPEYKDSKFYILGKIGDGTKYLKQIAKELNIEDSVIFTDSVSEDEKVEYLKKSKHYFQMSIFEGFGVAALEALCAKNIVIHSGKGGLNNPIYENGIKISIDQPFCDMFEDLKNKLLKFDNAKLDLSYESVVSHYNNDRRKNDFLKIITE